MISSQRERERERERERNYALFTEAYHPQAVEWVQ